MGFFFLFLCEGDKKHTFEDWGALGYTVGLVLRERECFKDMGLLR